MYRNSFYFKIFPKFDIFNYLDYKPSIIDYYLIEHDFLIINKPLVEDLHFDINNSQTNVTNCITSVYTYYKNFN